MGLLECPPGHSRLVYTPHPVTVEGQNELVAQLLPGETLGAFLRRAVPDWAGDAWEVRINGVLVPVEVMERVRPKDRTLIEVRGIAKKTALYIVAMVALTYFTFGLGSATAGGWGAGAAAGAFGGGVAGALFASAVFVAGSVLINKVLGPKPPSVSQTDQNTVYTIGASRNQARPYQPLGLPFGRVKYAPDILSAPYTWFEGDEQYVGMVLTPGVNVHRVEELYLGDALLSSFQGVQVYYAGFPGMPEQKIPLYTDADTINGGELSEDGTWVQRTTPPRTVRILVNLAYVLGDADSKGRPYLNTETVEVQYRPAGSSTWTPLISRNFANSDYNPHRATLPRDVAEGQYDVRTRIRGRAVNGGGSNGQSKWQWETMVAVQADPADYSGIPRIGIRMKASGQLQNAPDEIRCVAVSRPVPVWTGTEWVTQETSNPGAHLLAYARGINDEHGNRIAGMGLPEEMIDVPGLQAFMLHCAAEGFGYDYVVKDARNHDEMLNSLALAGFGQVSWASGRMSPIWAADEQPLSGVVGMGTIKRGQFQVDYTLASAADGIEFTYYDAEDWSTKTLRIPAPGVTTMLNPTQVTGEGITSEAHAAMLARWHLAQSLYQYKDISYSTDLEHLSYRRLSVLSLSHDLTQWGFSGRVVAARVDGGTVTIDLDEPVRAPETGKAYVGLRVPGEKTYRVFEVRPFEGKSARLQLVGAWPSDAALPGNTAANPAVDTLWCYDFKPTPGYRVRVVALQPESGMKGARVSVVPEGPEFWEYVRTGHYIRPPNQSLLQTRPVASDLLVTERQVVQGDTVYTELVAQWEVSGPVGDTVVQMADANGQLQEVARTTTRSAAWRIPGAGTYQVAVRPFAPDGRPGIATGTIYSTIGADAPPVLVDLFDVEERSGGVRLYTWGWFDGTTRSADFAGVEIRVTAGKVTAPDWDAMEPVGNADGYHTAPFEAVVPESGDWTFAARSRNTSGTLSTGMRVVAKTLGRNLGEQIGGIGDKVSEEIVARIEGDAKVAGDAAADAARKATEARQAAVSAAASDATTKANNARTAAIAAAAADATTKANAARDAAILRADAALAQAEALAAEIAEIVGAPEWEAGATYNAGWLVRYEGGLYRARAQTTGQNPATTPAAWEKLGDYESVGEALAAALAATTQLATDLGAEVRRLDAVVARLPSGNGALALQATVTANAAASVQRDEALASRQTAVEAKVPADGGRAASEARATAIEQAAATAAAANSARSAAIEAKLPVDGGRAASTAQVTAAELAAATANAATAQRVDETRAALARIGDVATYTVVSDAGLGSAPSGSPRARGVYNAAGERLHTPNRGFNFFSINSDSTLNAGVRFDTYGDLAASGPELVDYVASLPEDRYVLVVTSDHVGSISGTGPVSTGVRDALLSLGASPGFVRDVTGSTAAIIVGRRSLKQGGAIEVLQSPTGSSRQGRWAEYVLQVIGGVPLGMADSQGIVADNAATASALQVTDAKVVQQGLDLLAVASRTSLLESKSPADGGRSASEARVVQAEQTAATAAAANASRISALEARNPAGTGRLATEAQVLAEQAARAAGDEAAASRSLVIEASVASLQQSGANMVADGGFERYALGQVLPGLQTIVTGARSGAQALQVLSSGTTASSPLGSFDVQEGRRYYAEAWTRRIGGTTGTVTLRFALSDGGVNPIYPGFASATMASLSVDSYSKLSGYVTVAAGSSRNRALLQLNRVSIPAGDGVVLDDLLLIDVTEASAAANAADAALARIIAEETVRAAENAATVARVATMEARVPAGGGMLASEARVQAAEQAAATANAATASRLDAVRAAFTAGDNLVPADLGDTATVEDGVSLVTSTAQWSPNTRSFDVTPGEILDFAAEVRANETMSRISLAVRFDGPAGSGVSNVTRRVDLSNPAVGTWYPLAMSHAVPAGATRAAVRAEGPAAVSKSLRRPRAVRRTAADLANAAAVIDAVQAAATANSATASRVSAVEAQMPAGGGRVASEASVTQLQTVVTAQGQQLAQQITTVDTKAGNAQTTATQALAAANGAASAILDVRSSQTGGGNLLQNADFGGSGSGHPGWSWAILEWGDRGEINLGSAARKPDGSNTYGIRGVSNPSGSNFWDSDGVPAEPGDTFIASAYLSNLRSRGRIEVVFVNSAGVWLATFTSPTYGTTGGNAIASWPRAIAVGTAPAGTTMARARWITQEPGNDPYAWITMPMLEKAAPGQTKPSPWSPGAGGLTQVTQELRAGLDAKFGVYVTNDGLISGFESVNDGVRPEFNVLASVFRIVAPGGGARTEYSDGNHRVYDAQGRLRVRMGVW
ncbi:host specificity factor TipJ family phage tail protein [Luteimonas sp. FCS-9]|uniref:host specificity factor TipJ family phage tail protein n=1 Tax=Luteimonas sp. FCS-9 TaxID=1547516 RepID=UPI00069B994E|nr:host specificity factor TipJ family phage tail protein [Luteimonas sp. FCS-9]